MKFVVLGTVDDRSFFDGCASPEIEIVVVDSAEAMLSDKNAKAYFDFSNSGTLHWETFYSLAPGIVFVNAVSDVLGGRSQQHIVRINAWPGFMQNRIIELSGANPVKPEVEKILELLGYKCEWVSDQVGMVAPRVVAMIINEAYFALGEKISTKEEIDTAMKLGTNYPFGPFEWGKKIGLKEIYSLLTKLQGMDDRYVVSSALKDEAQANI